MCFYIFCTNIKLSSPDTVRSRRTGETRLRWYRKRMTYTLQLKIHSGKVRKCHISCPLYPDDKYIDRYWYRRCCWRNPPDRTRMTDSPKKYNLMIKMLFINRGHIIIKIGILCTAHPPCPFISLFPSANVVRKRYL